MSEPHQTYTTIKHELDALDMMKAIQQDQTASHWLKHAVTELWERDVVDALNDLDILRKLLETKHQANVLTLKRLAASNGGTLH